MIHTEITEQDNDDDSGDIRLKNVSGITLPYGSESSVLFLILRSPL